VTISDFLLCAAVSFVAAAVFMVSLRPIAQGAGWVDRPGGRKTHEGEVPVIGGLAMYAAMWVTAIVGMDLAHHTQIALLAAGAMVLVGTLDDRFNLSPTFRLAAHVAASTCVVAGTDFDVADVGNQIGTGQLSLGAFAPLFTVVACVALVNAFNMLDGLDGLAGGSGLLAAVGCAAVALTAGAPNSSWVAVCLASVIAGFLVFNVPAIFNRPFRSFMGDAGSTLLGFMLAFLGLALVQTSRADMPPVLLLWFAPIPIFELFSSTLRRAAKGQSPFHADANHFHHVLMRAGLSVRQVFVLYFTVSAASVAVGLAAYWLNAPEPALFAGFLFFAAAWYAAISRSAALLAALRRSQVTGISSAAAPSAVEEPLRKAA
jgi:UDP-GlcNAc:undecaprenyl-phosphate GlcNAc-1-phosphate transferase